MTNPFENNYVQQRKVIPVTGRGGLWGCETSRLPHFLDNRLTDGGEVSLTHLPPFTPGRFLVLISIRGWVEPQGHIAAGRIRSIEKSNELIGNRTRDHPACSIVPQVTTLPRGQLRIIIPENSEWLVVRLTAYVLQFSVLWHRVVW
jgi:hypothetical protein